ncbi:MAG TPA: MBL fold metallo-hydrolase [Candidatus Eremiobacteraceae bacterium]|nr:MBL fold metallo-hydrolase [Candidatus Eremiobacteraceae bacterium]
MIVEHFPVGLLGCNCVVLGDEATKSAVVVDPGDEVDRIGTVLRRHALKVVAIVATHAHIDHVGAMATLKDITGAPAMLHEADLEIYRILSEQARWLGVPSPPETTIDRYLEDGGRVEFGAQGLDVVHTPGHSPGSVTFVAHTDSPLVIAGDTLFNGSIGRTDLWGGSFDAIITSIRTRLLTLPEDWPVICGHGPDTTIGHERDTNPFLVRTEEV